MEDSRVTCKLCLAIPSSFALQQFGNPAKPAMGHAMRFTKTGRTAECMLYTQSVSESGTQSGAINS